MFRGLKFLAEGVEDGVPVKWFEDQDGRLWKSYDPELLRKRAEEEQRPGKQVTPSRAYHKRGKR